MHGTYLNSPVIFYQLGHHFHPPDPRDGVIMETVIKLKLSRSFFFSLLSIVLAHLALLISSYLPFTPVSAPSQGASQNAIHLFIHLSVFKISEQWVLLGSILAHI